MPRLRDILQQQRKKNFVGRQKELEFFTSLLKQSPPAYHLIHIYGPGGQGKTSLLKQFADVCKESSIPAIHLDCRYIEAHPDNFKEIFQSSSPFGEGNIIDANTIPIALVVRAGGNPILKIAAIHINSEDSLVHVVFAGGAFAFFFG